MKCRLPAHAAEVSPALSGHGECQAGGTDDEDRVLLCRPTSFGWLLLEKSGFQHPAGVGWRQETLRHPRAFGGTGSAPRRPTVLLAAGSPREGVRPRGSRGLAAPCLGGQARQSGSERGWLQRLGSLVCFGKGRPELAPG